MSVTDELRAELTKRGVEWSNRDGFNDYKTVWHHAHTSYLLIESLFYSDRTILKVRKPTVAQAIAATLGAGTCELINAADDLGKGTSSRMCFKCGYTALDDWWDEFKYCPNCGRRIVEVCE